MESQNGTAADIQDSSPDYLPRVIADDYIEYFVYVLDPSLTKFDRQELLRSIRLSSHQLSKKLLGHYIWHCEGFSLEYQHKDGK